MSRRTTIALDAMGGDHGALPNVEGAIASLKHRDVHILIVGDRDKLTPLLDKHKLSEDRIEIIHAPQAIGMDESPRQAVELKPDASVVIAARLVSEGRADALVSAGSTGSVVLSAASEIPRINGVRRTAIAAVYPTLNELQRNDNMALIIDVGANVQCNAEELVQFAIMGSNYVSDIRNIEKPVVSLLNIGEEPTKGGKEMQRAYQMLQGTKSINFAGNIEGKDVLRGISDVIVTEGFVGNILIKTLEGAAQTVGALGKMAFQMKMSWKMGLFMLRKGLDKLHQITDYSEYGGAPLLGFEKMVIIAHGRSNAKAISNAIKLADKCVRDGVTDQISKRIREFEVEPHREFDRMSDESI